MARQRWWNVVGWAATVAMVITALAGLAAAGYAAIQHDVSRLAGSLAGTGFGVTFWHWIRLGAFARTVPPVDPDDAPAPVGPWGVVGGVLTGLLVLGFIGITVWSSIQTDRDRHQAEQVRDDAVRAAKARDLTVGDVQAALIALDVSVDGRAADGSVTGLLEVEHGTVARAAADGDRASILIRPDRGGPPCAVVDIVGGDRIRGRLTNDC